MKPALYEEITTLWKKHTIEPKQKSDHQLLEIHKKLLSFFQVGDFFYFVVNLATGEFEFISNEVKNVLGYDAEEMKLPFIINNIHPDDVPWFVNFENYVIQFYLKLKHEQIPNYKVRYDYRIKKKDGTYVRILQQVIPLEVQDGVICKSLGLHTDISHIKMEGKPMLSMIGLNGEPSYVNIDVPKMAYEKDLLLSAREREILSLITDGKSSEEISALLYISIHTVHTHRKNILNKTGCVNTASLISYAIKNGLV